MINNLTEIIKPKNDLRKYKSNIMKNKIKYILVEDNKIDSSYVCVTVKIGSINDPIKYQGLAHFLEHMLFLGSKKYPKEDYFDSRLKECGGYSNAGTADFITYYYFKVNNNNLFEVLDIFSRFFIDPLFDKNSVDREINAVNSEHQKNLLDDSWIIDHIYGMISKKNSDINKFGTGNLETLNKKDVRKNMIKFYNDYYCSDNISVSIISKNKLDYLEKNFLKIFNNIPYKRSKIVKYNKPFYSKPKNYKILSIGELNQLIYFWEIPLLTINNLKNKEWKIINKIFNYNGKNSLKNTLKNLGLIKDMSSYIDHKGIFFVIFDLAHKSLSKKKLVDSYFKYFLNELSKIENWEDIKDNYINSKKVNFNFGERIEPLDLVQILSQNIHYYDLNECYSKYLFTKKNTSNIKKYITKYLNINNSFQIQFNNKHDKINYTTDKYYNVKYGIIDRINGDTKYFYHKIELNNNYKDLNPKNIKISKKLAIPKEIKKRIWFGSTSEFNEPHIFLNLSFQSYDYINTPNNYLITILTLITLNYYLSVNFIEEREIGFYSKLNLDDFSLNLFVYGYNDKFNIFFEDNINFLKNIVLEKEIISINIKKLKEIIKNQEKKNPWEYLESKLCEKYNKFCYSSKILLEKLNKINIKDIINFKNNIFKGALDIYCYGNINEKNLPDFKKFDKNLKLKLPNLFKYKSLKSFSFKHPNKKEKNNCIKILYPCGKFNYQDYIRIIILISILDQPFYSNLRTKEQLGYLVSSSFFKLGDDKSNKYYIYQKIQSDKDLNIVIEKIKNFNIEFYKLLKNLNDKDWKNWKKMIKKKLKERDNSTEERYFRFIPQLNSREYNFNRNNILIKELKNVDSKSIIKFYKNRILNSKKIVTLKIIGN